ncbi:zinc-binding alcohol dehydrogenase family protein [Leptospira langatensis]|uniref:Zinc-binding alcohol dehydrogenase family protein n=1 Tax=Leptospira langatensis TaxID=2484983 RepID=A0A5F1ZWX4_9LEPT|nr:zinc-binding dehydrogenase [Leptospira langatensis]TGJ98392.1 zinc-binding alcohol dehydrogenase family protein [Leptospira langatensis]TGL43306.1 zinc-binding alcohol dehydrogenase family protein [Leptospira langatensis]
MKAAILREFGKPPVYEEFANPNPQGQDQVLMHVKTAAIKNIDKLRASGTHYASYKELPAIVGLDGVGVLENGTKVYAQGITGTIAEQALISKNRLTILPDGIDLFLAAALPNAVIGATMALHSRVHLKKGNVVLVNGATGVTGQLAVQVAKHYGAAKIIATGRNEGSLEKLKGFGADIVISLKRSEEEFVEQIKQIHKETPIDIVVDYLWGRPVELLLRSFKGGGIDSFTHPVKIVTVGDMAGKTISLESSSLRSSDIQILGSGLGSLSSQDIHTFNQEILPEMFQLAAKGILTLEIHKEDLKNIENAWDKEIAPGQRMVISIQ